MRILLCSPYKGLIGGISKWTNHIMEYYNEHKSNCEFTLNIFSMSRENEVYTGNSIYKRMVYGIKDYASLINGYNKKIKSYNYDIVHLVSSASISLFKDIVMLRLARSNRIRSVIHFRFGRIPELYNKRNWECKLLNQVIKLADLVIVIDQQSYDTLIEEGYKNIKLLPNPLTPKIAEIIEDNLDIEPIERKILFAGHVIVSKGVFELVEACKSIPNIKVKLIGHVTEEMKSKLLERAGDNNNWLEVAGELDYLTTIKEMLSAGVFVLPTYSEGFPNVILESMACGCPIVASSVGAIPEMLDINRKEDYGICVESKNVEQLTFAIKKMIDDREYALKCGTNAQIRVNEMYSMPIVWNQMVKIWELLMI